MPARLAPGASPLGEGGVHRATDLLGNELKAEDIERIVHEHGGRTTRRPAPDGGNLRNARAAAGAAVRPTSAAARRVIPRRVLVVDDEDIVADTVADMLRAVGYHVDIETLSTNVLDRLGATAYDAIISDVRMPMLDGPALWAAVRQRYPELGPRMIFVTGDLGRLETRRFLAEAGVESLAKPIRARAIRDVVARVTRA
jgi:CheY-like chemotaxis protein